MNKRKVKFHERVKVVYFEQIPLDVNVCWMTAARDRMRFKRRILDVEQRISWVFAKNHRDLVYRTLYKF